MLKIAWIISIYFCNLVHSQNTVPIRPGDPYKIEGAPFNIQTDSNCNLYMAWIKPPAHSSMSYHGHESACQRFAANNQTTRNNKTATMIDIKTFDKLVANDQFIKEQQKSLRVFFLKERVGDFAVMVLMKGNGKPKMELVDLQTEQVMKPQDILCVHQECLQTQKELLEHERIKIELEENLDKEKNNTLLINRQLSQSDLLNRDLTLKMVIYQVICALTGFLAITFGFSALALCIRLRRKSNYDKTKRLSMGNVALYSDQNMNSPSYYHMNGKVDLSPPSPFIAMSADGTQMNYNGETGSLNNIVMTNSSLSACDGQNGGNGTYISYPISTLSACNYGSNDASMIALMPITNRQSLSGGGMTTHRNILYGNVPNSPAGINNSIENKLNLSRNGSLTRGPSCYNRRYFLPSSNTRSPCVTPQFGGILSNPLQNNSSPSPVLVSQNSTDSFLRNSVLDKVKHHYPNNANLNDFPDSNTNGNCLNTILNGTSNNS